MEYHVQIPGNNQQLCSAAQWQYQKEIQWPGKLGLGRCILSRGKIWVGLSHRQLSSQHLFRHLPYSQLLPVNRPLYWNTATIHLAPKTKSGLLHVIEEQFWISSSQHQSYSRSKSKDSGRLGKRDVCSEARCQNKLPNSFLGLKGSPSCS